MSKITNDGLTRSDTYRMLYSCTRMATVGIKGTQGQGDAYPCTNC